MKARRKFQSLEVMIKCVCLIFLYLFAVGFESCVLFRSLGVIIDVFSLDQKHGGIYNNKYVEIAKNGLWWTKEFKELENAESDYGH